MEVQPIAFRRRVRRVAAGLAIAATVLSAPLHLSARPDLFDEIFQQGQRKNGGMRTLTASFVETTTSALLTRPLVASGTVEVERPSKVTLHYTQPDERTILIEGDRMTIAWPSRNIRQARDIGTAQKRIQKYFVEASPGELRSHFDVTAREADDRPGQYLVLMIPKRKQIQEGLTKLELWIDRSTLLMSAMRMTFPNGDTKLMTFSGVEAGF